MSDESEVLQPLLRPGRLVVYLVLLAAATVEVGLACSRVGIYQFTWEIWAMRLMRLGAAATVGAGLAVAGVALQGLLRNPLAEPYVLGVSSGAGVGVLVGLALAIRGHLAEWAATPVLAFLGAAATCVVVYGIAQRRGRLDPYVLLLSGVIVNCFNGAVMLAVLLLVDPHRVATFARWCMGELPYLYDPMMLVICVSCVAAGWAVLFIRGAWFNALGLGDDVAASCGVSVRRLRVETFVVVSVMTAAAVALAGPIGFLGLVVPHICRMLIGPDHRTLALFSGFLGAIFLMVADTLCRTAGSWVGLGDMPVGIITALCGGPFFIFLLRRRLKGALV